jgi:hypothetical protein
MNFLLIFLLIPYTTICAQRFLLDEEVIEFNTEDTVTLPGVFAHDMTIEVNNEKLQLPSELYEASKTYFIEDSVSGDAVMFSKAGKGALVKKKKFYNIGEDGRLSALDLGNETHIDPDEELNPLGHVRPVQPASARLADFSEDKVFKFNPGCWPGDQLARELVIGIVVDRSYALVFQEDVSKILKEVQEIITNTRLIMFLQMNVILTVGEIIIGGKNSPFPLNETSVQRDRSSDSLLVPFRRFITARQSADVKTRKASWQMLTNRWPAPGVVGMSYLGTLCMYTYNTGITSRTVYKPENTWYIFAHELGHSMGAYHSFENGQGRTGGIMDYGNYSYNGVVQFHPYKRAEICPEFQLSLVCPYFIPSVVIKKCGDGVLNENEECECLDGSVSCAGCVGCKAVDREIECSSEVFVFRQKGVVNTLAASESSLAQAGCCVGKRFVNVLNGRCAQSGGTCEFGQCQYRCDKFKIPACDLVNDGCLIPCTLYDKYCSVDLKTSSGQEISKVADGVRCGANGVCGNGVCSNSTQMEPSESPTRMPSRPTGSPSRRPTRRGGERPRSQRRFRQREVLRSYRLRKSQHGSLRSFLHGRRRVVNARRTRR